jgi:uncharacterized membrane protein YbhN (UPF0104 family)
VDGPALSVSDETALRSRRLKRVIGTAVPLGIVLVIFARVLPQLVDYGDVWKAVQSMSVTVIAVLLALTVVYFGAVWVLYMGALPSLRLRESAVSHQASTAVAHTVPGGGAVALGVSVGMWRSWGFTTGSITRGLALVGIWDQLARIAVPLLGAFVVVVAFDVPGAVAGATGLAVLMFAASVVLLALALRSDRLARRAGKAGSMVVSWGLARLGRESVDWSEAAVNIRRRTVGLIRARWALLSGAALGAQAVLAVLLVVSLRAVGVATGEVSLLEIVAAYSLGRIITLVPVTPGGAGVVEFVFIALLSRGMQSPNDYLIAAGVFTWRALTWLLPVFFGLVAWVVWRLEGGWRQDPTVARRGERHSPFRIRQRTEAEPPSSGVRP